MTEKAYVADGVTVWFDGEVCQHAGNCVRGLPAVFDPKARPWIQPGAATPDEVVAQVELCPSGALRAEKTADRGDRQA